MYHGITDQDSETVFGKIAIFHSIKTSNLCTWEDSPYFGVFFDFFHWCF